MIFRQIAAADLFIAATEMPQHPQGIDPGQSHDR
jgi:hypothetical protein